MFVEELRDTSDDSRSIDAGTENRSGQKCLGEQIKSESTPNSLDGALYPASGLTTSTRKRGWYDSVGSDLTSEQPGLGSLCPPGENHKISTQHSLPKYSKHASLVLKMSGEQLPVLDFKKWQEAKAL